MNYKLSVVSTWIFFLVFFANQAQAEVTILQFSQLIDGNRLLRQYFPKGMDLSKVHQNRLNAVARQLNERPGKTLNYETPAERFNQCVASIG
jgi:hypothetical protein